MKFLPWIFAVALLLAFVKSQPAIADAPTGWKLAGDKERSYSTAVDDSVKYEGMPSAVLQSIDPSIHGFGTLMQKVVAQKYLRKRVRYSGRLKVENVNDSTGLWLRIDGPSGAVLDMDNMDNRGLKGTGDWKECSIVLDVPAEAKAIAFGVILRGTGKVWVSDLKFEPVGTEVATTSMFETFADEPINLDFKAK